MKNSLQISFTVSWLLLCLPFELKAQTPFSSADSLDINNIKTWQLVHGDMWNDPNSANSRCEFPKGSGKNLAYSASLWFSGFDDQSQLRVSAQTYRDAGIDFWPGPLDIGLPISYAESEKWAKLWKLDRWELEAFLNTSVHTLANTPTAILQWPARGNSYATGHNGSLLNLQNRPYAPFVDVDMDGIYNALNGDYPAIKGDQAIWFIYNDHGPTHNVTDGLPLELELVCMAYAYKRNSLIDNVIFYEYQITNKNQSDIDSFVIGMFGDLDLGYSHDDFFGYDSTRNMGIVYNGDPTDGVPGTGYYLDTIPQAAIRIMRFPGDTCGNVSSAGSFLFYSNGFDPRIGDATNDTQFNYYMRARWRDGSHLKDFPNNNDIRFLSPDDPSIPGGWSECAAGTPPWDRRIVLSSQPFQFTSGSTINYAFALVATPPKAHNGCPNATFADVRAISDTAQAIFCNPLPIQTSVQELTARKLSMYPNPADKTIMIECDACHEFEIDVFDMTGRRIEVTETTGGREVSLDVSTLSRGVYHVIFRSESDVMSGKFIKR